MIGAAGTALSPQGTRQQGVGLQLSRCHHPCAASVVSPVLRNCNKRRFNAQGASSGDGHFAKDVDHVEVKSLGGTPYRSWSSSQLDRLENRPVSGNLQLRISGKLLKGRARQNPECEDFDFKL